MKVGRRSRMIVAICAVLAACAASCAPSPAAFPTTTPTSPQQTLEAILSETAGSLQPAPTELFFPQFTPTMTRTLEPSPTVTGSGSSIVLPGWVPQGARARIGRGTINQVAVSPDGKTFAVAGSAGIFLYRAEDYSLLWSKPTGKAISEIAFSADGSTLAAAVYCIYYPYYVINGGPGPMCSDYSVIMILRAADGSLIQTIIPFPGEHKIGDPELWGIALSPDGTILYLGAQFDGVSAWDSRSGRVLRKYTIPNLGDQYYYGISFTADGTRLGIALADGTILILDLTSGETLQTLKGDDFFREVLAFSPDMTRIAVGAERKITLWNIQTGKTELILEGLNGSITSLAFSPDGKQLMAGDNSGNSILWDAKEGHCLRILPDQGGTIQSTAFVSAGGTLLTATKQRIAFWNAVTGQPQYLLEKPFSAWNGAIFSQDGVELSLREDGRLRYVKTDGFTVLGERNYPIGAVLSQDYKIYALITPEMKIEIFETESGKKLYTMPAPDYLRTYGGDPYIDDMSFVFSPDGKSAITDHAELWDFTKGRLISRLEDMVYSDRNTRIKLAFSKDGKLVAYAEFDSYGEYGEGIWIFDAASGKNLSLVTNFDELIWTFSSDNRLIATGCDGYEHQGLICTYDVYSGGFVSSYSFAMGGDNLFSGDRISTLEYSPSGKIIAAGTIWGQVVLLNSAGGDVLRMLKGHTVEVTKLAFSPDGKTLASASADGTVVVWDLDQLS